MAITYTLGAYAASASAPLTVAAPAGQVDSDVTFLFLTSKTIYGTGTVTWAPPEGGWVKLNEFLGFPVGSAADTGIVNIACFFKYGVTGSAVTTLTTPGNSTVMQGQMITCHRTAGKTFAFKASTARDTTDGANYSTNSNIGNFVALNGDQLFSVTGMNSDSGTWTVPTITVPGLTVGTVTNLANNATTLGDDGRLLINQALITAGTTQSGPATAGGTAAAFTGSGTSMMLRIREVTDPAVSIVPDTDFHIQPRYQLTITGLGPFDQWKIERRGVSGEYATVPVRGGDYQDIPTSSAVLDDIEFHFSGREVLVEQHYYDITVYSGGIFNATVTVGPVTPATDYATAAAADGFFAPYSTCPVTFISDPIAPSVDIPVMVMQFDTYDRAGAILGNHKVLGRRNPVIVTDTSAGMTGSFTILAMNVSPSRTDNTPPALTADRGFLTAASYGTPTGPKRIEDFFNRGNILMMRHRSAMIAGIPDFYFVIDSISIHRLNRLAAQYGDITLDYPYYEITVQFIETDRPATLSQAVTSTWQNVLDVNDNWGDVSVGVSTANTNWLDVLLDGE